MVGRSISPSRLSKLFLQYAGFTVPDADEARGATLKWLEGGDHQFASVLLQEEAICSTKTWFQKRLV